MTHQLAQHRTAAIVGVVTAVMVAALVAALTVGGPAPERGPVQTPAVDYTSIEHVVVYGAEGDADTASYTYATPDGGTEQVDADLPLATKDGTVGLHVKGFESGDFVYLSVQNSEDHGSVTCQIIVDGDEISVHTSSGAYVIATCQGTVP